MRSRKSLKLSEGKPEYTFYDGPPFAINLTTGKSPRVARSRRCAGVPPESHFSPSLSPSKFRHILAGTIKDTVTRYAHQTNHYVSRRFGWDCHGLPVEYEIDKKLKITGRDMVLEMGIETTITSAGASSSDTSEWRKTVTRLGRWIDFDNDYKTMDPNFMESVCGGYLRACLIRVWYTVAGRSCLTV